MYKMIVVPLDGSELAEVVLPHVEVLVKACTEEAEIVILQVCEPLQSKLSGMGPGGNIVIPRLAKQAEETCKEQAKEYLAGVEKKLKGKGFKVRSEIKVGSPGEEILDYATNNPVDLIAMASHGRSGISRWAYGSVTSQVLRGIATPILVVTPEKK
jgi:nucleotide-binding universal stress UspA family protein